MLNIGCALARSKYICTADNNHLSLKLRLSTQYQLMEKNENIVALGQVSSRERIEYSSLIIRCNILHQIKYYKDLSKYPDLDLIHRLDMIGDVMSYSKNLIERISN